MIKAEDILKANQECRTTDIRGSSYVMVNQRIAAFRKCCPNGAILTEEIYHDEQNGKVKFRTRILNEEGMILSDSLLEESAINLAPAFRKSYYAIIETSSIGRALGMAGFGIDNGLASYEDVSNAIESGEASSQQNRRRNPGTAVPSAPAQSTAPSVQNTAPQAPKPAPSAPTANPAMHAGTQNAANQVVLPNLSQTQEMSLQEALNHACENTSMGRFIGKPMSFFIYGNGTPVNVQNTLQRLGVVSNLQGTDGSAARRILAAIHSGEMKFS